MAANEEATGGGCSTIYMRMWRILLVEPLSPDADARLRGAAEIVIPETTDEVGLAAAVVECDAIVARTQSPITRTVIEAGKKLRAIGVAGVGLDRLDQTAAAERGIKVLHTPGAASDSVAELTVAMMLQLLRPIPRLSEQYRTGNFKAARASPHGDELRELTIGIFGFGRIGSRVGRICAAGIGARVLFCDIRNIPGPPFPVERVEFDGLLRASDFLTIHTPLTAETSGLFDATVLAAMRPTARLINTARGEIVDTAALVEALQSMRLAGAALDVVDPEPLPADHALFKMPQVILTPHIAARTFSGYRRMCDVVDAVLLALRDND